MTFRYSLFIIILAALLTGCASNQDTEQQKEEKEVTISAAASLKDVLTEIKPLFEAKYEKTNLLFNFGGSGSLQLQIMQGAPVDVFLSAAEDQFDELKKEGLIDERNEMDLIGNQLVLIVPKNSENSITNLEDLKKLEDQKFAIGTPEIVPAGKYAMQTLKHAGLWEVVQNNIVRAKDVRQVLTYVETGNVTAGLVYKTDALLSDKVKTVAEADPNSHDPIIYPAGVIKSSHNPEKAQLFFNFLQEPKVKEIFQKYGFQVLD